MARPELPDDDETQMPFAVRDGFIITDFDEAKTRRYGGETIMLTRSQARHYQKINAVDVDVDAMFDGPSTDKDTPSTAPALPVSSTLDD